MTGRVGGSKGLRVLVAFLLGLLLAGSLAGCQRRARDLEQVDGKSRIVIKFSHVVAENTPKGLAARRFAELVRERTRGRVEVQVYANSTLYKDGEEVKALQEGNVQMIAPATAKMTEYFPSLLLLDLPYLFDDYDQVHRALDGKPGQLLLPQLRGSNMLALAMWDNGFKQVNTARPVNRPEDLQGLRFRIMPSRVLAGQFDRLGATTIPLAFSDVYSALESAAVDGSENTFSNIYTKKFHEVQRYITVTDHGYLGYVVLTNEAFWRGLPEDLRQVLEETLEEVTRWEREVAVRQNRLALEEIRSSGKAEVRELTPEEKAAWREALLPLHQVFSPVIGEDLMNAVREVKKGATPPRPE